MFNLYLNLLQRSKSSEDQGCGYIMKRIMKGNQILKSL